MLTCRRVFDWDRHEQFARASCDFNPIHMDTVAARRTSAGAPIVHGMHALIWALECFVESVLFKTGARRLKVQFLRPIYVGERVSLELIPSAPQIIRARAFVGADEVMVASIGFNESQDVPHTFADVRSLPVLPPAVPNRYDISEMDGLTGCLSLGPMMAQIEALFPRAVQLFGLPRIAALACSSCLVGMVVPGFHSMFSGFDVSLAEDDTVAPDVLRYAVVSLARRFRLVRIGITARSINGALETVSRLPPVSQPSMAHAMSLVSAGEFRNSTTLIIGGSRGLGELTSKLIAAGGSRVIITYATGKTDADAVVEEIRQADADCVAMAYDVKKPASEQLASLSVIPTHVYYFATPHIFHRKVELFDPERFRDFNLYYLKGFFELIQACIRLRPEGITAFYPSSTAIETRPATMTEYTMSKAAGEVLCDDLSRFVPGVRILTRRLPRLPTDQTSSVVQGNFADPIEVMLPIVRQMQYGSLA
jgi:acyl dehydratase